MRTQEELKVLYSKFNKDVIKRGRLFRLLLVIDQFFNVLLWNGSQDETVSSHIGRKIKDRKATKIDIMLCKLLRLLESKHCMKSLGE